MTDTGIYIFGEVLFDHFPDGKRVLGGAPFNVAWHLQAFGLAPHFISRVGADAEGEAVLAAMRAWGMDTQAVQIDSQRPTGRVSVQIVDNEPSYDIVPDCAYDAIEAPAERPPAGSLIYHGTLAIRSPISCQSLDSMIQTTTAPLVFLDVNLRPPWWDQAGVLQRVNSADWVKLNSHELLLLAGGSAPGWLTEYGLAGVIETRGAEGAQAWTSGGEHAAVRPDAAIELVDTVGAGDAFTAVAILGIISGWPLALTLERAQRFASLIVGRRGATVDERAFYAPLLEAWELSPAAGG